MPGLSPSQGCDFSGFEMELDFQNSAISCAFQLAEDVTVARSGSVREPGCGEPQSSGSYFLRRRAELGELGASEISQIGKRVHGNVDEVHELAHVHLPGSLGSELR